MLVETRRLARSFRAAGVTVDAVDIVRLRLTAPDGSVAGEGEIAVDAWLERDAGSIAMAARAVAARLTESSGEVVGPSMLEVALDEAASAAPPEACMLVEMAFLDHIGRERGLPVWRILNLPEPAPIRLFQTVPVGEEPPRAGLLKVKLGGPGDIAVLRGLAGVRGPLVIDVNNGWDRDAWNDARMLVAQIAPAVLEDPVDDLELLPVIRSALPTTAIILDEGIPDLTSLKRALQIADGANIKLTRFGGLLPVRRALEHLNAAGATSMLGCTIEPPRAIAYAAQLASMCNWTDLDGHFWLTGEPPVSSFRLDSSPGIPQMISS